MKAVILKENLKEGLNIVNRITPKNLSLPILNNILIVVEKNFLELSSTDLEIGVKWYSLAKGEEEGKIVCPGKTLQSLVDLIPEEKISFKKGADNSLLLETKNSSHSVKCFDPDDFPIIPSPESNDAFEVNGEGLCLGLGQVIEMAAVSTIKPEISGVLFRLEENFLRLAATDTFRLAEKKIFFKKNLKKDASFIVPQKTCREIINIFGNYSGDIRICLSANQVLFEALMEETPHPRVQLTSRLIEGEYPNYQEIIPKDFASSAILSRTDFLNQIKAASIFSGKINDIKVKIDPGSQQVKVMGQSPELGQSSNSLGGQIEGQCLEASFNWRFLSDGLKQIKDQEVFWGISKEDGPSVIKGKNSDDYLYLAMPLRV